MLLGALVLQHFRTSHFGSSYRCSRLPCSSTPPLLVMSCVAGCSCCCSLVMLMPVALKGGARCWPWRCSSWTAANPRSPIGNPLATLASPSCRTCSSCSWHPFGLAGGFFFGALVFAEFFLFGFYVRLLGVRTLAATRRGAGVFRRLGGGLLPEAGRLSACMELSGVVGHRALARGIW